MALRISTNIGALNTQRQLSISQNNFASSMEKLSSGFRINRAADDAAGLAIAGKLRVNLRAFGKAYENTTQATSMIQVAEGAIDQVENIVGRLKELATQAASTNTDSNGRARLNDEFAALVTEINRIADTTKYGSTQLINGNFGALVTANTANAGITGDVGIASSSIANSIDVSGHIGDAGAKYTIFDAAGTQITLTNGTVTQTVNLGSAPTGSDTKTVDFDKLGVKITVDSNYADQELEGMDFTVASQAQNVQIGALNQNYDRIALSMGDMNTDTAWSGTGDAMDNWGISTVTQSLNALNSIDAAIEYVTTKRGDLGALQNRLGYAAANLATTIENVSAAESTIRDVDMAKEMSTFTKNQILMQAGTAMLAQANIAPQQVLSLFG